MPEQEHIEVRLNGEVRHLPAGSTLGTLLESLGRDPRTVAVELNGTIVRRADYDERRLVEGAKVEVVHFVQGG